MNILLRTSANHTDYTPGKKHDFIVLHYTAGTRSTEGVAEQVADMFKNSAREASADFIVDDAKIVQYNPDLDNRSCYSVGGSLYSSMSTSEGGKYYRKCTNYNSISIEMCSRKKDTSSLLATDTDWYLTDATVNNARQLVKYLMDKYSIDIDHVIMHHHVNGKVCPNPWCVNEAALAKWNKFKDSISGTSVKPSKPSNNSVAKRPVATYAVRANKKILPEVTGVTDYAGLSSKAITDVAIKVSEGSIRYRVHVKGGKWLPWVSGYNWQNASNGYAGNGKPIDAIQIHYNGDHKIRYRVAPIGSNYYPWQVDTLKDNGMDGYAGAFGKSIGKLQIDIV